VVAVIGDGALTHLAAHQTGKEARGS